MEVRDIEILIERRVATCERSLTERIERSDATLTQRLHQFRL